MTKKKTAVSGTGQPGLRQTDIDLVLSILGQAKRLEILRSLLGYTLSLHDALPI